MVRLWHIQRPFGEGGIAVPQVVTDDGCRIRYSVRGDGPPLLMIPGWQESSRDWGWLLPLLARRFTCITVDQRGTGFSGRPWRPWSADRMADDAVTVLDALGLDRAHVLGYSLGGITAQEVAHRHPGRVDRLVLVETSPGVISVPPNPWMLVVKVRELLGKVSFLRRIGVGSAPVPLPPQPVKEGPRPPAPQSLHQLAASLTYAGVFELRNVRAPSLIVHGTADLLIPPVNARLTRRLIRGSRLELIEGVGHDSIYRRPREIAALVSGFLGEGARPASAPAAEGRAVA